jgi:hypothetical protein
MAGGEVCVWWSQKFWHSKLIRAVVEAQQLRNTALRHGLCAVTRLTQRVFHVDAPPRCVVARSALSTDVVYLDVFMDPARVIGLSVASWPYNLVARNIVQYHAASTLTGCLIWHVLTSDAPHVMFRLACLAIRVCPRGPATYPA